MDEKKIGQFIAKLRKERNMTQEDLANTLYIDRSVVSKWERGVYIPKHEALVSLSKLFDVSISEILLGEVKTKKNKDQLNEIPITIIKESNKKIRKVVVLSGIMILTLSLIFFISYFINNYNSIKVYTLSGESENFAIYDGVIVSSREKVYILLGNIEILNNSEINKVKLYYNKDGVEHIIYSDEKYLRLTINVFKSETSIFNYKDFNYIKNNLKLEITYDSNKTEIISLRSYKDFTNDNFYAKPNINNLEVEEAKIKNTVPKYFIENFELDKEHEMYYLDSDKDGEKIREEYYYNANLYVVKKIKDNKTYKFEYVYPNDIIYRRMDGNNERYLLVDNLCTSDSCDMEAINHFIDDYINKINFEKVE